MNFSNNLNDFLIYSYFGIDPELCVDSDKIVDAVVNCARIDASRHVHSFGEKIDDSVECIKSAVNELRKACSEKKEKVKFDQWHYDVYVSLKQEDGTITYGIAQKWINMTLKYLWLIGDEDITIIKSSLHVPVDRYILMAAAPSRQRKNKNDNVPYLDIQLPRKKDRNNLKQNGDECAKDFNYDDIELSGPLGCYSEGATIPWSQWGFKEYAWFQKCVRAAVGNNLTPIEWESKAWIKQAIVESNKSFL